MCKNSSTFDLLLKGDFQAKANMHLNRPFAEEKALPVAFKIQAKCLMFRNYPAVLSGPVLPLPDLPLGSV